MIDEVFSILITTLYFSSVIILIASGLTLIYGVMRIINIAHGAFYALGLYIAYTVYSALKAPELFFVAVPIAAVVVGVISLPLYMLIYKGVSQLNEDFQILFTFGLLLAMLDMNKLIWGLNYYTAYEPFSLLGYVDVLGRQFPVYYFYIIGLAAAMLAAHQAVMRYTRLGVRVRATASDIELATTIGINVRRISALTFAVGAAMAGIAGASMLPISGAFPGIGFDEMVTSFIVVAVGGLGSIKGVVATALAISGVRVIAIRTFPELDLILMYALIALILVFRPYGIFGKVGRKI